MKFNISKFDEFLIKLACENRNEFLKELKEMNAERRTKLFKTCCFNDKLTPVMIIYGEFETIEKEFNAIANELFEHAINMNYIGIATWVFDLKKDVIISDKVLIDNYRCADGYEKLFMWLIDDYKLEMKRIDKIIRDCEITTYNYCFIEKLCEKGYKIPKEVIELKTTCSSNWINEMKKKGYVENNLEQTKKELLDKCNELMEMIKNMK